MDSRVTQLDLARRAGVSISTVSRALSDAPGISAEVRRTIRRLAQESGYAGRGSRAETASARATAFVTLSRATGGLAPFYEDIVKGLLAEARGASLEVDLRLVDEHAFDAGRLDTLNAESGVFLVGIDPLPDMASRAPGGVGPSVVLVNGTDPQMRFDGAAPANFHGGARAVEILKEAGHRSILYVTGHTRWTTLQRLRGFRSAIDRSGDARGAVCEVGQAATWGEAEAAVGRLLDGERDWTAVFCMNDILAVGALQALEGRGLLVPQDVSVLGFDDLPCAAMTKPRLSTLRVEREELGRQAVRLMLRRLADRHAPAVQVEVGVVPVEGGTVGPRRP